MDQKYVRKISVVGLGYVGLPIAIAFGKKQEVIAFDISQKRVQELQRGYDRTMETRAEDLINKQIIFTANPADLRKADFHIVAVPTPINNAKQPDLACLISASEIVGKQLKQGDIVVYESTVYPGATEEDCAPVLEKFSGLKCGEDFFIGYSPERINPADKEHTFTKICKVVSGQNDAVLDIVADVYANVITAGVHRAPSIKVAEAAKVIENTQRDINIALINELAVIFEKMNINTADVLQAAGTKWNFLNFKPGLVGGHCIGVDPYYLTHKAHALGLNPEVILSGRRINDNMGKFIAEQTIKQLTKFGKRVNSANVAILGLTFKENCNDIRNTKVIDIADELRNYNTNVVIHDPLADPEEVREEYGINLCEWDKITNADAVVLAVAHDFYLQKPLEDLLGRITEPKIIIDVKSIFKKEDLLKHKANVWRL